jgi:formaldehyde-activating enzyme involved in methanogenesis
MNARRLLYVFVLVLLGGAWLPLSSSQAQASGTTATPPLIATIAGNSTASATGSGSLWAKDGALNSAWTAESTNSASTTGPSRAAGPMAVAADPTNGPLIATVDEDGNLWAKEGSLTAKWTEEINFGVSSTTGPTGATGVTGAQGPAVASDPTNGPLIAVLDGAGNVWAKEGSLTAPWTEISVYAASSTTGPEGDPTAVAVASDATHGPLIAVVDGAGNVWVKEGSLTAPWTEVSAYQDSSVTSGPYGDIFALAVASDATNGPLIAVVDEEYNVWVKEGSVTAPWTEVSAYSDTTTTGPYENIIALAVASDATNGPLIAVIDGNDNVWAKEGSLTTAWTEEATIADSTTGPQEGSTALAVAG